MLRRWKAIGRTRGCLTIGIIGLREIAVDSDVDAEGSVEIVLSGKHYNRAACLHKIVYEAMMRVVLQEFDASLTESSLVIVNEEKRQIEKLKLALNFASGRVN